MRPRIASMLERIDMEIAQEYIGGAIDWADKNCDNAWTNAIEQLERALARPITNDFFGLIEHETRMYVDTCIGLIAKYRQAMQHNEIDGFLNYLKTNSKGD
jgi:hypothetical protein